jgi:hypothetical protein
MRRRAAWFLLLPLMLGGCGDRSLIMTVDVLSFLSPSDVTQAYSVPGGMASTTMDVASESVNLLPGVESVTEVSSATLKIGASFDNQTGSASGTLVIYIASADSTDPFTTTPIASLPVTLTAGNVTNVSTEVSSTELAQALVHQSARVGIRITFDSTATLPLQFVTGSETITQLQAVVITKKKL